MSTCRYAARRIVIVRAVVVLLFGYVAYSVIGLAGRKKRLWSFLLGRVLLHLALGTTLLRLASLPLRVQS